MKIIGICRRTAYVSRELAEEMVNFLRQRKIEARAFPCCVENRWHVLSEESLAAAEAAREKILDRRSRRSGKAAAQAYMRSSTRA